MVSPENIFFVAFEFPPFGSAGVLRSVKFVQYLPEFNVRPIVITIESEDYSTAMAGHPMDETLCKVLPPDLIIERIHCPAPDYSKEGKFQKWSRIFFSVMENFDKPWKKELVKKLPALIKKYQPKAIYVTLPPFAMGPLWAGLAKRFNLPLIIDFRDAWTQWCVAPNASYFHYRIKLGYERRVLKQAAQVICSSAQIMKDMLRVHPGIDPEKFHVINNGYDSELKFGETLVARNKQKFTMGYVGSFYYTPESRARIFTPWYKKKLHRMFQYVPRKEDWLYRSPYFFFRAIAHLLNDNPGLRSNIEIRFAGKTPGWLKQQITLFGLDDICKHEGFLKRQEVIGFQEKCDVLLITSSKVLGGRDYSIAGKTYEYFTIGRPILGFVCEGEQKDILEQTGVSVLFDPDNTPANAAILKKMITEELVLHPNLPELQKYHRRNLTSMLAKVIQLV